jgi:hypothetical protein
MRRGRTRSPSGPPHCEADDDQTSSRPPPSAHCWNRDRPRPLPYYSRSNPKSVMRRLAAFSEKPSGVSAWISSVSHGHDPARSGSTVALLANLFGRFGPAARHLGELSLSRLPTNKYHFRVEINLHEFWRELKVTDRNAVYCLSSVIVTPGTSVPGATRMAASRDAPAAMVARSRLWPRARHSPPI